MFSDDRRLEFTKFVIGKPQSNQHPKAPLNGIYVALSVNIWALQTVLQGCRKCQMSNRPGVMNLSLEGLSR